VHGATCSICSVGYRQFAKYLKFDSCWSGLTRTDERRPNEVRCLGLRALEHRCHDELCGAPLETQTTVEKFCLQAIPRIFSLSLDRSCMTCMLQLAVLCKSERRSASEGQTMSPSGRPECNSQSGMVCSGGGWLDALCRRDAGRGLCSARKTKTGNFLSARVAAKRGGKDGAPIRNYCLKRKKNAAGLVSGYPAIHLLSNLTNHRPANRTTANESLPQLVCDVSPFFVSGMRFV